MAVIRKAKSTKSFLLIPTKDGRRLENLLNENALAARLNPSLDGFQSFPWKSQHQKIKSGFFNFSDMSGRTVEWFSYTSHIHVKASGKLQKMFLLYRFQLPPAKRVEGRSKEVGIRNFFKMLTNFVCDRVSGTVA